MKTTTTPISSFPGELHTQKPQTYAEYLLPAALWGAWWDHAPVAAAVRPKAVPASSISVTIIPGAGELARVAVWGGVDGARYEIRFTPALAFQVRFTSATPEPGAR